MRPLAFACWVMVISGATRADEVSATATTASRGWVANHVQLRQSVDDKNQASKPAAFLVTLPRDGKPATWAIDAGLKAADCLRCRGVQLEWNLGAEYHRHTDLEKPQNTIGAAAGLELLSGVPGKNEVVGSTLHDLSLTAELKSDVVKSTRSLLTYLDYTPVNFVYSGLVIPSKLQRPHRWVAVDWLPTVGFEEEAVIDAAGKPTGNALRARGALDLEIYPLAALLDARLQLYGHGELRQTLASSYTPEARKAWAHLLKAGALYYLDRPERFALGAEFGDGANPRTGLDAQKTWTLGLRIQLPGKREKGS